MAAKRRTKAEIEADKFDKVVRGAKLVPARDIPLACSMCGQWVLAKIVAQTSNTVDGPEEAGILFELVLFAGHDCLEP